jgi:hypothetical protein
MGDLTSLKEIGILFAIMKKCFHIIENKLRVDYVIARPKLPH